MVASFPQTELVRQAAGQLVSKCHGVEVAVVLIAADQQASSKPPILVVFGSHSLSRQLLGDDVQPLFDEIVQHCSPQSSFSRCEYYSPVLPVWEFGSLPAQKPYIDKLIKAAKPLFSQGGGWAGFVAISSADGALYEIAEPGFRTAFCEPRKGLAGRVLDFLSDSGRVKQRVFRHQFVATPALRRKPRTAGGSSSRTAHEDGLFRLMAEAAALENADGRQRAAVALAAPAPAATGQGMEAGSQGDAYMQLSDDDNGGCSMEIDVEPGALPSTSFDLGPQQLLARRDSHAAASTSTAVATVVELPHGTPAWYHLVAGFGAMALTPDSWALQDFDPEQTKAGNKRGLSMANLAVVRGTTPSTLICSCRVASSHLPAGPGGSVCLHTAYVQWRWGSMPTNWLEDAAVQTLSGLHGSRNTQWWIAAGQPVSVSTSRHNTHTVRCGRCTHGRCMHVQLVEKRLQGRPDDDAVSEAGSDGLDLLGALAREHASDGGSDDLEDEPAQPDSDAASTGQQQSQPSYTFPLSEREQQACQHAATGALVYDRRARQWLLRPALPSAVDAASASDSADEPLPSAAAAGAAAPPASCSCLAGAFVSTRRQVVVYADYPRPGRKLCQVQAYTCSTCDFQQPFVAADNGFFEISSGTWIAQSILTRYLSNFVEDGQSVKAFVRSTDTWFRQHMRAAEKTSRKQVFISATTFRKAWYRYLELHKMQWCFKCSECGDDPEVLVCDGSYYTMQKQYYVGAHITEGAGERVPKPTHRRRGRCFTATPRSRKHLQQFSQHLANGANRGRAGARAAHVCKRALGGTAIDSSTLVQHLDGTDCRGFDEVWATLQLLAHGPPSSAPGSSSASRAPGALRVQLKPEYPARGVAFWVLRNMAAFVFSLGSDSAVCSYVSNAAAGILDAAHARHQEGGEPAGHFSPSEMEGLRQHAPLLHAVLDACCTWVVGFYPWAGHWGALLQRLMGRSEACFEHPNAGELPSDGGEEQASCLTDECLQSGVCSGVPRCRQRPHFEADPAPGSSARGEDAEVECRDCNKSLPPAGKRTGGVFSWYCRHGVCYAFYVIPTAEGRNEAFSFLYSYFKRAPRFVVYDFACALSEYCLNRAPQFFRDTTFLIDRFHIGNHSACGLGFALEPYDQHPALAGINTQVAEQAHSALQKIKPIVTQMKQQTYMQAMRLYLHHRNVGKNAGLAVVRQHVQSLQT